MGTINLMTLITSVAVSPQCFVQLGDSSFVKCTTHLAFQAFAFLKVALCYIVYYMYNVSRK